MKKYIFFLAALVLCGGLLLGCECAHEWTEANCVSPMTCTLCGETAAEKLGHNWTAANCTSPMTCTLCGEVAGEKLGHNWIAGDCENPRTCSVCKKTVGNPIGHDYEKWDILNEKEMYHTCQTCDNIERKVIDREVLLNQIILGSWDSIALLAEDGTEIPIDVYRYSFTKNHNFWWSASDGSKVQGTWTYVNFFSDEGRDCYEVTLNGRNFDGETLILIADEEPVMCDGLGGYVLFFEQAVGVPIIKEKTMDAVPEIQQQTGSASQAREPDIDPEAVFDFDVETYIVNLVQKVAEYDIMVVQVEKEDIIIYVLMRDGIELAYVAFSASGDKAIMRENEDRKIIHTVNLIFPSHDAFPNVTNYLLLMMIQIADPFLNDQEAEDLRQALEQVRQNWKNTEPSGADEWVGVNENGIFYWLHTENPTMYMIEAGQ